MELGYEWKWLYELGTAFAVSWNVEQWMMLITVTGRKTGKEYTTPVGYYRENG